MAFGQNRRFHIPRSENDEIVDEEFSLALVRVLRVFYSRYAFELLGKKLSRQPVFARRHLQPKVIGPLLVFVRCHFKSLHLLSVE